MEDTSLSDFPLPENLLQPLFAASNSSNLERALEILINSSRSAKGRSYLASKNILPVILQLSHSLHCNSHPDLLILSLKLIRNLCAGEIENQNSFIENCGVELVSTILSSFENDLCEEIIRIGLQILGNVSLAGGKHQESVWQQFFPFGFSNIARVRRRETCDPLCMIVYTSCENSRELLSELCGDQGMPILVEIVRTATAVGFGEDWLKLLLSRICIEESFFTLLFSRLSCEVVKYEHVFASVQVFLLSTLSEILNDQINKITISSDFVFSTFEILNRAIGVVDFFSRGKSNLPTGSPEIDVLGYSLTIVRDICAQEGKADSHTNRLISLGVLELLLSLLSELEPPSTIRKTVKHEAHEWGTSNSPKVCPYKGFRRDIVAIIGNCAYRRKYVQDNIRDKNFIFLLLQQCVTDEDNPFLREWGAWTVRNLLEGNEENQRIVAELEIQGSVDVPEIAEIGLRVEVDPKTRRAKLVNMS